MWKVFAVVLSTTALACGDKAGQDKVPPEPVAECQQYEAAMDRCFHRESKFASQSSMIPKTEADRARIKQTCLDNLQRIQTACR